MPIEMWPNKIKMPGRDNADAIERTISGGAGRPDCGMKQRQCNPPVSDAGRRSEPGSQVPMKSPAEAIVWRPGSGEELELLEYIISLEWNGCPNGNARRRAMWKRGAWTARGASPVKSGLASGSKRLETIQWPGETRARLARRRQQRPAGGASEAMAIGGK